MSKTADRRILYYSEGWGLGGIESYIMLAATGLDRSEFSFDVFCTHDWDDSHDQALEEVGARRFAVFEGHRPNLVKRTLVSGWRWRQLLRREHYDVVHVNTMNGMGFMYAWLAARQGVPVRLVHSHNSGFGVGHRVLKSIFHRAGQRLWSSYATDRLACSREAGEYLFGDRPFRFVRNSVDTERFAFDAAVRAEVRAELGITDGALLFGSVGRIVEQKNPLFQVEVLRHLVDSGVDAALILAGAGPLEKATLARAKELGVSARVHLPGGTKHAERYYCALDVFSMPSVFEGFGITVIEAMASGCPCVLSDQIPVFDFDVYLERRESIKDPQAWAETIESMYRASRSWSRNDGKELVEESGYGRADAVAQVLSLYQA